MTFDGKAFGTEIVDVVKGFVTGELKPILKRLDDLESQIKSLPSPKDGKDADPEQVAAIVRDQIKGDLEEIRAAVAAIPVLELPEVPELPDIPKMVDEAIEARMGVEDMERSIEEVVRAVVAEIPAPKDGKDGSNVIIEDVMPAIEKHVDEFLATVPIPENGKDGRDGVDGKDGLPGEKGESGKDGADIADTMIDRDGNLVVSLTDGRLKNLGPVVGRDGAPGADGQDGKDGVGFDDLDFEYDGEKTAHLRFVRGDQVKEFTLRMPVVIDRGLFSEGKTYEPGDGVTWARNYWIAQKQTAEKPCSGPAWRLAVKGGRDGKDGKPAPAANNEPIRVGVPKGGE